MARVELNEQEMDNVVGGVFQFYGGGMKCKVGGTKYACNADGQFQVINLINANPDATEDELIQMAIQQGIIWLP